MYQRPLLLGAIAFLLGSLGWQRGLPGCYVLALLLLLPGSLCLFKYKAYGRMLLLAVLTGFCLIGGILRTQSQEEFYRQEMEGLSGADQILLQGKVLGIEYKNQQFIYKLGDCIAVRDQSQILCRQVLVYQESDSYSIGQTLLFTGQLKSFSQARNQGNFDQMLYYKSQQIDFALDQAQVIHTDGRINYLGQTLYQLRKKLGEVYDACLKEENAGVLKAMVLGDKSSLDTEIKALYQSVGISHILAISGLHVSILGMGIYRLLRRRKVSYRFSFLWAALVLLIYVLMTGAGVSTLRAAFMLLVCMYGDVIGRGYDGLNALGGVCLVLLWDNPMWTGYAGFVFSVGAVAGILTFGKRIQLAQEEKKAKGPSLPDQKKQAGKGREKWKEQILKCKNTLLSGLAIYLVTLPLVAYYYYEVPIYGILLNLLILPALHLLFLFAFLGGLVGLACLPLGKLLLIPCSLVLEAYQLLASGAGGLPYSQYVLGCPGIGKILLFYGILILLTFLFRWHSDSGRLRIAGVFLLFLLFFLPEKKEFSLDLLDVGQGDGIYLRTEEGVDLFIDGGSTSVSQVGTYRILPFLKYRGVGTVDYWFVTHGDQDHLSGLEEIIESGYSIGHLVLPEAGKESLTDLIALAEEYQIPILYMKTGDCLQLPKTRLLCLWPGQGEESQDTNDLCLVLLYESQNFTGIFTGDIASEQEQRIQQTGFMERYGLDHLDFYKAAHHGSRYSNSLNFLQYLSPDYGVISCSSTNSYGHPSQEAIDHIVEAGTDLYFTMKQGQIHLELDRQGQVQVSPYLEED